MYCNEAILAIYWVFLGGAAVQVENGSCLDLRAALYHETVLEHLPLVIRVTLANTCESPVPTWYYSGTADLMERWAVLVVQDEEGKSIRFNYVGGPTEEVTLPPPRPLVQGAPLTKDFVRSLIFRRKPPPRWAGKSDELMQFIAPGSYVARLEVPHIGGKVLVSNDFVFEVLGAKRSQVAARDRITPRNVAFFEGRDHPSDVAVYDGQKSWKKVDVSRFGDIQTILDDYPESEYAKWIRFWKIYHHGSEQEALKYARTHKDFPLSDNLMLRVINRVADDDARHDQAIALLAELQRIFPDGDTAHRAKALREKLLNKKRRP